MCKHQHTPQLWINSKSTFFQSACILLRMLVYSVQAILHTEDLVACVHTTSSFQIRSPRWGPVVPPNYIITRTTHESVQSLLSSSVFTTNPKPREWCCCCLQEYILMTTFFTPAASFYLSPCPLTLWSLPVSGLLMKEALWSSWQCCQISSEPLRLTYATILLLTNIKTDWNWLTFKILPPFLAEE